MSVSKAVAPITLILALALPAPPTLAQAPTPYGAEITLETAKKIAAAAIVEAVNPAFAIEKARTAAMFRRPSRTLEDTSRTRVAVLAFPGATPVTGGLPILVDGKIICGIGVSGVTADQNEQVARAGLDGLK